MLSWFMCWFSLVSRNILTGSLVTLNSSLGHTVPCEGAVGVSRSLEGLRGAAAAKGEHIWPRQELSNGSYRRHVWSMCNVRYRPRVWTYLLIQCVIYIYFDDYLHELCT